MHGKFTLSITLGNAAMQSHSDIASALRMIAEMVDDGEECVSGRIGDANGNRVGKWDLDIEEPDDDTEESE